MYSYHSWSSLPSTLSVSPWILEHFLTRSAGIWSQTSLVHVDTASFPGGLSLHVFGSTAVVSLQAAYFPRASRFVSMLSMRSQDWLTAVRPPGMRIVSVLASFFKLSLVFWSRWHLPAEVEKAASTEHGLLWGNGIRYVHGVASHYWYHLPFPKIYTLIVSGRPQFD